MLIGTFCQWCRFHAYRFASSSHLSKVSIFWFGVIVSIDIALDRSYHAFLTKAIFSRSFPYKETKY